MQRYFFFICQFLAVIINSQLFLTRITGAIHYFLSKNFSCKFLPKVTELLTQKVEIWCPSQIAFSFLLREYKHTENNLFSLQNLQKANCKDG